MVITFLTMYNKNQFFYNTHGNYKNINLNFLLAKSNTRKPCLRPIKVTKKDHELIIYNMIN